MRHKPPTKKDQSDTQKNAPDNFRTESRASERGGDTSIYQTAPGTPNLDMLRRRRSTFRMKKSQKQSQGSNTEHVGQHEETPKMKLYDFKLALSEFYLNLVLLQNYQSLNYTGFRKILKKHDKVITSSSFIIQYLAFHAR